jgi:hypothetical protein
MIVVMIRRRWRRPMIVAMIRCWHFLLHNRGLAAA